MDNYGTHKVPKVTRRFLRHPRYHLHFTPTTAGWLNQWNAALPRSPPNASAAAPLRMCASSNRRFQSYLAHHNDHCKPFIWTATGDAILDKGQAILRTDL